MSLDGVGAYDHVSRAAFLSKRAATPKLRSLVPLAMALYGTESRFLWTDENGIVHTIYQGEGGEQGDPLMPAFYSLAQHDALFKADRRPLPNASLLSFLDNLYVVTCRAQTVDAFH